MAAQPGNHGHSEDRPKLLGRPDGAGAVLVEATGAYEGLRAGERRWVTGSAVDRGLSLGILLEVHTPAAKAAPAKTDVQIVVEGSTSTNTVPVEVTVTEGTPFDPAAHTAKDVIAYLKAVDDAAETKRVKALERKAKQPRKTILDY